MSDYVLFAVAPALAVLSCVVLSLIRLSSDDQVPWVGTSASPHLHHGMFVRVAIAVVWSLLIAGHLAIFAWPQAVLAWNRATARRIGLEAALVVCGIAILIHLLRSVGRRLRQSTAYASAGDTAFDAVMLVAVVSGLGVAVLYRWASMSSVVTLTPFAASH